MKVTLVAATRLVRPVPGYVEHGWGTNPYPEECDDLAEMAGRLCYLSWDRPNPATRTTRGYLAHILEQGHFSVLEHSSATFHIAGVTRNFTHELIRHRHLSFSEVSQRYVDVSEFPFIVHPGLQPLVEDVNVDLDDVRGLYRAIVAELVARGYSRKEARQAARHILPGGMETQILVTGNLRAWREVLGKRLAPAADAEFRAVARQILGHLLTIAPDTFQDMEVSE